MKILLKFSRKGPYGTSEMVVPLRGLFLRPLFVLRGYRQLCASAKMDEEQLMEWASEEMEKGAQVKVEDKRTGEVKRF